MYHVQRATTLRGSLSAPGSPVPEPAGGCRLAGVEPYPSDEIDQYPCLVDIPTETLEALLRLSGAA